jgi:hypothetical protein
MQKTNALSSKELNEKARFSKYEDSFFMAKGCGGGYPCIQCRGATSTFAIEQAAKSVQTLSQRCRVACCYVRGKHTSQIAQSESKHQLWLCFENLVAQELMHMVLQRNSNTLYIISIVRSKENWTLLWNMTTMYCNRG